MLALMSEKYTSWDDVPLSLTVDQAAAVLSVHPNTVRAVIKSGALAAKKVGREWRIARANLRAYLEGKRDDPDPALAEYRHIKEQWANRPEASYDEPPDD